jgi:hypothetical protein
MDLRCPHRKFGEMLTLSKDPGLLSVSCPSRWCGHRDGVVILHTFDTSSGVLVETRSFREPRKESS